MNGSQRIMREATPDRMPNGKLIFISEYRLWEDFRRGDVAAYAEIYRKYFFVLYDYGKKISSDRELIKDCIQDLFMKIWNNRQNLKDTTSVKYYLFTSLKRKLMDTLKSHHERLKSNEDVMEFEVIDTGDAEDDELYEQKEKVLRAINKLSRHQQKLLHMKFYGNQSNQEMAEALGITIQAVYNSMFRTLRSIRKKLQILTWIALLNLGVWHLQNFTVQDFHDTDSQMAAMGRL